MKKGFTLIELLAVIVILAIIAVIAVPIVIDIIDEAKINSVKSSANMYLKAAELYISNAELNKIKIEPGTYGITEDGNICIGIINENECNGEVIKIEVKGNKPNSGQIIIDEKSNIKIEYLEINGYVYYKENKEYVVEKGTKGSYSSDNGLITLDSSKTRELSNYRIYGNSYQATRSGKNLFNVNDFIETYTPYFASNPPTIKVVNGEEVLDLWGGNNDDGIALQYMKGVFKDHTQYTFSFDVYDLPATTGFGASISIYYTDETRDYILNLNRQEKTWLNTKITSNINKTIDYIKLSYNTGGGESYIKNFQIEEGTNATEYEEYGVSPSPEYPSEIKSVGNYNDETNNYEIPIKVTGKNLWDNKNYPLIIGNYLNNSNQINHYQVYVLTTSWKKLNAGTYTVSGNVNGLTFYLVKQTSSQTSITTVYKSSANNTFTLEEDAIISLQFNSNDKDHLAESFIDLYSSTLQLEIGDKDTKYEPYKEENYKIELEEPLRCVGDVCDYIDYESGKVVRYIVEINNDSTKTIEENFEVLSKPIIENIELPKINLHEGVNNIFIETDIKPSKVSVNYYKYKE